MHAVSSLLCETKAVMIHRSASEESTVNDDGLAEVGAPPVRVTTVLAAAAAVAPPAGALRSTRAPTFCARKQCTLFCGAQFGAASVGSFL
jgi:hypothetical protein